MRGLVGFALLLLCLGPVWPAEVVSLDSDNDGEVDSWYETSAGRLTEVRVDRNGDGRVDYRATFTPREEKSYEEFDFNFDGEMDDFYFYLGGLLVRQEVDSNYDGRVDLWVYLHKGIYIERYEQDTDFDGKKDRVVDYARR
jgi:hypothetical protein